MTDPWLLKMKAENSIKSKKKRIFDKNNLLTNILNLKK